MARRKKRDRIQRTVHFRQAVDEFIEQQRKGQETDMSYSCMCDLLIYRVLKQEQEADHEKT